MSASDATTLTCVGDDAVAAAAPTKLLPSPLIDADGSLVPRSCKFAAVCALAGDQTACSSYECVSHAPVVMRCVHVEPRWGYDAVVRLC